MKKSRIVSVGAPDDPLTATLMETAIWLRPKLHAFVENATKRNLLINFSKHVVELGFSAKPALRPIGLRGNGAILKNALRRNGVIVIGILKRLAIILPNRVLGNEFASERDVWKTQKEYERENATGQDGIAFEMERLFVQNGARGMQRTKIMSSVSKMLMKRGPEVICQIIVLQILKKFFDYKKGVVHIAGSVYQNMKLIISNRRLRADQMIGGICNLLARVAIRERTQKTQLRSQKVLGCSYRPKEIGRLIGG